MPEDSLSGAPLETSTGETSTGETSTGETGTGETGTGKAPAWIGIAKIAVISMGVIFIAGFALVAVTIVNRLSQPKPAAEISLSGGRFGVSDIHITEGDHVKSVTLNEERIAINMTGDKGEEIIIVDVKTGVELGRIRLHPLHDLAQIIPGNP